MNYLSIYGMGSMFLMVVGLIAVKADFNDQELYVPDYYLQNPYRYNYRNQFQNDHLRPNLADESAYFLDYPDEMHPDNSNHFEKRVLSSFRERTEREKSKEQQEKFAEFFLQRLQDIENERLEKEYDDNKSYIDMIENLWEKYKYSQYNKDHPIFIEEVEKRQIPFSADYSTLGWSGVGYKKRLPDTDLRPTSSDYLHAKRKRFPVAKRSSNFYKKANDNNKKLLVAASGTDPRIVQDLSRIFGNKQNLVEPSANKSLENLQHQKIMNASASNIVPSTAESTNSGEHLINENKVFNSEPLNIKKKSIDWSNYFGIDRRKKKNSLLNNEIDNDWLIKKYNTEVTTAEKRNFRYPLNIFRNHNVKKDSELPKTNKALKKSDGTEVYDIEDKLKNMEDAIIDEALKYTGAHEGATDPAKIQEIKDKVISRLAAAYSLEKMRRALSEFKSSLTSQKYENERNLPSSSNSKALQPKLQADLAPEIDEKEKKNLKAKEKCTSKTARCDSNEMTNEIQASLGHCESIESRCVRVMGSNFNSLFYPLCKWHHLCYLCMGDEESQDDENDSDEKLGMCDLLFLQRAEVLCHRDDIVCTWAARPALATIHELKPIPRHCNRNQYCAR